MPTYSSYRYVSVNEAKIFESVSSGKGQKNVNKVLMGTWLGVTQENGDWFKVVTAGKDGWIHKNDTSENMGMKVFFVDVGQGDAILIEVADKRIIVDGGPNTMFRNYLTGWQYTYLLEDEEKIKIDYIFVSHFDDDHYHGLIDLINDSRFEIGTIFHNGIARMTSVSGKRLAEYNTDLGTTKESGSDKFLTTTFNDLAELTALKDKGGLQNNFYAFAKAVENAQQQGRLSKIQRITSDSAPILSLVDDGEQFDITVLGPVVDKSGGNIKYKWFDDSSKTRNGHSLVLKLKYGNMTLILGGDLNKLSENHLLKSNGDTTVFDCDIAKSCHHGSSDFEVDFMAKLNPRATVISSGDNESYSHPRADAIGCAGKYSKSEKPLVFSTELARSINKAGDILYGMINLRTNGKETYMSQMKEQHKDADLWDSYKIK